MDHNENDFLANTVPFVRAIGNPDYINLLLTELRDEDVNISMYGGVRPPVSASTSHSGPPYTLAHETSPATAATAMLPSAFQGSVSLASSNPVRPGKINRICTAMRAALLEVDKTKFFHSILTTYARQIPSALEIALECVRDLRDGDGQAK